MFTKKSLLACLLFSAIEFAWAAPTIDLQVSDSTLTVGEDFSISVLVSNIESTDQLLAFGFDVAADPLFSFLGGAINTAIFTDDSIFFPTTDVAGSAFPAISGDNILLATLSFKAVSAGTASIGIFADAADFGLYEGLFTENSIFAISNVKNLNVSPVPEPETWGMLLSGLGLVVFAARRKKRHLVG